MENKSFLEKALVKAEDALDATPEYKDWKKALDAKREAWEAYWKAEEAKEKAMKAEKEAWKAVEATPAYKPYKEAFNAWNAVEEATWRLNYESNMKVTCAQAEYDEDYDEDIEIKKLKVFISIPMNGKSKSEIEDAYHKEWKKVRDFISEKGYKGKIVRDIEIFNGYVELEENSNVRNSALNYLGASLQKLSEADAIWMGNGWIESRGCKLEWICASRYGMDVLNFCQAADRELPFLGVDLATEPRGDE